ncbi:hypothetical protein [Streptomyces sp. NPDC051310]|uniref:hypothetical protein n=1 Tax=Streptomyces sp. NPDC051310 TaxID=3365649 RepID=UPI0037995054
MFPSGMPGVRPGTPLGYRFRQVGAVGRGAGAGRVTVGAVPGGTPPGPGTRIRGGTHMPTTTHPHAAPLTDEEAAALDAHWRAADHLSAGQLHLRDNPLLGQPSKPRTSGRGCSGTGARPPART